MRQPIAFSAAVLAGIVSVSLAQSQIGQGQSGQTTPQQQQQQQDQARQRSGQSGQQQSGQQQAGHQEEQQGPEHLQKSIRHAASDNQFEIQVGQMVQERAQNPQVKQLAQRLVQDHQRAQQQLQQVAQQANVTISDQLMPVQQAMLQEMQQKQGQELERAFTFHQVGGHEKDILMAQWAASHEQNQQFQQYARQQIPVLEEHLKMARMAAGQFVPEAREAGERIRGNTERNSSGTTGADHANDADHATSGTNRTSGVGK